MTIPPPSREVPVGEALSASNTMFNLPVPAPDCVMLASIKMWFAATSLKVTSVAPELFSMADWTLMLPNWPPDDPVVMVTLVPELSKLFIFVLRMVELSAVGVQVPLEKFPA